MKFPGMKIGRNLIFFWEKHLQKFLTARIFTEHRRKY